MRALRPIAKLSCLAAAAGVLVPSAAAQETPCDALTRPAFEESIAFDSHGEQVGFQLDRAGARLPFDLEADEVSEISGNALLPSWGVPCGYGREANLFARQVELSFGTAELRPPSFNEGRGDGEDNDDAEDDGAVWRSFTTLGAGFADSSGLVGGRWEAAYAGAYDSESGEFEGFLGGRGQISLFDERLTASGDLALSRDDQAGETASAALTRLDLNILRGGALELTGYGTYGVIGAGFSDDDIDYEGDREITALGATLTWDRADLAFEHSRARDNLSGVAPETRRWSVWQGELGYNPDGAHVLRDDERDGAGRWSSADLDFTGLVSPVLALFAVDVVFRSIAGAKPRFVTARRQFDTNGIGATRVRVITPQPAAQAAGFHPHDRVGPRIEGFIALVDIHRDRKGLQPLAAARQRFLHDIA